MEESLRKAVLLRSGNACEYCLIPDPYYPGGFEIDHIISKQHGGRTILSNLALACLHCNAHKGPNVAGLDPRTKRLTQLYHPRRHRWKKHFRWGGPYLAGKTAVGRVTVDVLAMNDLYLVELRAELIAEGLLRVK